MQRTLRAILLSGTLFVFSLASYTKASPFTGESYLGIADGQKILGLLQNPTHDYDRVSAIQRTALTTSLSNTETQRKAVTALGQGLENVTATRLDNSLLSRSGVLLGNLSFMALAHDASHEYGHYRAARNEGAREVTIKIGLLNRSSFQYDRLENASLDARFRIMAAGLNQNSLNGLDAYRHSQLEPTAYYHDLNKIYSRMYLYMYLSKPAGNPFDDHTQMMDIMKEKGYDVTHGEFQRNSTLITLLSPDNWQSLFHVGQFLYSGKRASNPTFLHVNKLGMGLPSLSQFFTEDGDFVAYRQYFTYGQDTFELSADHDLDATHKNAGLNRFRIGLAHPKRYLANSLTVNPYAHMTFQRSHFKSSGLNVGIKATGRISSTLFFSGLAEVNHHDLMARANGRGNGLWASLDLNVLF